MSFIDNLTIQDCINYMKTQIRQQEKYPANYKYNTPYYRKTVEYLEQVKDRQHGEWEHWGSPFSDDSIANSIVCSLCKARYVEIEDEVFNFCPNCGADMRKEGEVE